MQPLRDPIAGQDPQGPTSRATRTGPPRASEERRPFCTVEVEGRTYCIDPLGPMFEALGRRWSLFLIAVLGNRRRMRFRELQTALLELSPRTLSDRLKELEGVGLIERTVFATSPPRVEYALTAKGEALRRALVPMLAWAEGEVGAQDRR